MKKSKQNKNKVFVFGSVFLLLFAIVVGLSYVNKTSSVLGDRDDRTDRESRDRRDRGRRDTDTVDVINHEEIIVPLGQEVIVEEKVDVVTEKTSVETVKTESVVETGQNEITSGEVNKETNEVKEETSSGGSTGASSDYKTSVVVNLVPVTERSVTGNSGYVAPVVTKSVLKDIRNKIEQVGRGEILSKPTPTVFVVDKKNDSGFEATDELLGDVDIFYKIIGEKVLLGAKNSEGRQLRIKDEDLRSAEISLNKILDSKKMKLSMTGDNRFALVQGEVVTVLDMPIQVNTDSHKLYLETSQGKKELKVYPGQAIKQAVDLKFFDKLNSEVSPSVEEVGGELAYKVVGDKKYNVLGSFSVTAKQNVYVAAETGGVVEGNQPLLTQVIRLISR